ncbi:uncharacterized protein PFL1_00317 [Pseudozyma flocculosa PF-1]|nr:uncharacterized protein PFL1_00317 [Pseudozyma flocculosa PF-1]EPQ32120.1 hypothetical protein PFL1_00317 [Pseudozyma flocculosa PF-1]
MSRPEASSVTFKSPGNDLARFLEICKDVGIFVILRPGPYINAESNGGGFPGWVSNLNTQTRISTPEFRAAWEPYMKAISQTAAPFQAKLGGDGKLDTSGGTLIAVQVENEFTQNAPMEAYFNEVIDVYRQNGITVPTTFNALGGRKDYSNNNKLDLWGADSYPQGFDCSNPDKWNGLGRNYTYLSDNRPSNPRFVPEFQAGSFDPWGGPGYEQCSKLISPQFVRVFDKNLFSQGVKLLSHYMGFGGTSWGNFAFGGTVYTSYDYAAPIDEKRIKREKVGEYNVLGQFLQSFPEFASSSAVANATNLGAVDQSAAIQVTRMTSAQQGSGSWYIVRNDNVKSTATVTYKLSVQVAGKPLVIPRTGTMTLNGRDSTIISIDKPLDTLRAKISYSTADISFVGKIGNRDVVVAHADVGKNLELQLAPVQGQKLAVNSGADQVKSQTLPTGELVINWTAAEAPRYVSVGGDGQGPSVLLVLAPSSYAQRSRSIATASAGSLDEILGTGDRILVGGNAYHIANGTVRGDTLQLYGQLSDASTIEVFAPPAVKQVSFNGEKLGGLQTTDLGVLRGSIGGPSTEAKSWQPPALTGWKAQDSLPEIKPDYVPNAAEWIDASLTSTPNSWFKNATTGGKVLFAASYGFYSSGNILWRGSFNVSQNQVPSALELNMIGGDFFAASVYLNGRYLGFLEDSGKGTGSANASLSIPKEAVQVGKQNVVTIIQDDLGLEESGSTVSVKGSLPREQIKQPRGILGFRLVGGPGSESVSWKVAGNLGGGSYPDQVRGILNEGGLAAERGGWHLPGFDYSKWAAADPAKGFTGPGVQFYRTSVDLNVPAGHDLPLSFVFDGEQAKMPESDYRALLFVNGWQFGRRLARFGPQTRFPVPPGIINPRGRNEIGLAVWSLKSGAKVNLKLAVEGRFKGDVDYQTNNPTYQQVRGK